MPHLVTLTRDLCCVGNQCAYVWCIRQTERLPIPPTPRRPVDKPELRQPLEDPKRVPCLGFFFVATRRTARFLFLDEILWRTDERVDVWKKLTFLEALSNAVWANRVIQIFESVACPFDKSSELVRL